MEWILAKTLNRIYSKCQPKSPFIFNPIILLKIIFEKFNNNKAGSYCR